MNRILACLSPSPSNPKILRAAADMAGDGTELIALFVETPRLSPSVTVEDISGWTMRQLRDRIDESSGVSAGSCRRTRSVRKEPHFYTIWLNAFE